MNTRKQSIAKPLLAAAALALLAGAFTLAAASSAQAHDGPYGYGTVYRPSVNVYVGPSFGYYAQPNYGYYGGGFYGGPYYGGYSSGYMRPYFDRSQHRLYHGYWRDYGFGGYSGYRYGGPWGW